MKTLKPIVFIMCLFIPAITYANEPCCPKAITLAIMAFHDLNQTMEMNYGQPIEVITYEDGSTWIIDHNAFELNPLLSEKPSREDLIAFGLVGIGIFYLAERYIPPSIVKDILLDSIIATERLNIEHNQEWLDTGSRPYPEETVLVLQINIKGTF